MQWLQFAISADSTTLTLADHGRVFDSSPSDNPFWYYMPSLAVNCAGDMVSGFSGSSATNYIGAFYSCRLSSSVTLNQPASIRAGTTSSFGQWGDYSATMTDPADPWRFWTVQEYATPVQVPQGVKSGWGTIIAGIRPNP